MTPTPIVLDTESFLRKMPFVAAGFALFNASTSAARLSRSCSGVKNAKGGQVQFRADKTGVVQCTIGRASFTPEQLRDNLAALVDALNKAKPAATKGIFLKKLSVSSTMGVGVKVDVATLSAQQ